MTGIAQIKWTVAVVALALSGVVWVCRADTITVDGTVYEKVYVREGPSMYYIQIPETGEIISVRKADVDPDTVHISENESYRKQLHRTYKRNAGKTRTAPVVRARKRQEKETGQAKTATMGASAPVVGQRDFVRNSTPPPVPSKRPRPISNLAQRLSERGAPPPVFIDRAGVMLFTTNTEKYRGDDSFIEYQVRYEQIKVPQRFRGFKRPGDYTSSSVIDVVNHYSGHYGLDTALVFAVIRAESNFNPHAVSRAGARGLMQLMPGTAAEMGVTNVFDPAENIAGGTQYLHKMLKLFDGDVRHALAAYNAGPGNVRKYGGIPPFPETRNYISTVLRFRKQFAGDGVSPNLIALAESVDDQFLPPTDGRHYTIRFRNGLTQRTEKLHEDGDFYVGEFDGRQFAIRKSHVSDVLTPTS